MNSLTPKVFINLNLNKDLYNEFINPDVRKYPFENEYRYVKYEFIELTIPDGYIAEYLPENSAIGNDDLGCEITYKLSGNKILYQKKFYLNYLLLTSARFESFNNIVKKFSEAYKESIILKKK
jgi:hypothetical protein